MFFSRKSNLPFGLVVVFFISSLIIILISANSSLDIFFSNIFYEKNRVLYNETLTQKIDGPSNGFINQNYYFFTVIIRKYCLPLIYLYVLVLPVFSIFFNKSFLLFNEKINFKNYGYLLSSAAIMTVGVGLLKNLWGRARPKEILDFGGENVFTPWFSISNACESNCSFVSGDATVGFFVLSLYFLTKNKIFLFAGLILGFFIGLIRISLGAHFLSDILMAFLISCTFLYFWHIFYFKVIK
tara:strand:+ start:183 stop:905 length:723 start_codon:yes stop_codon:yes gene_type:complete